MDKYHWTQHDTDFFKTPRMKGYAHPVVDEYGEDVIDDETGKQVWCNKPKQDMGAMEESAKAGEHLVDEAVKQGGVVVEVKKKPGTKYKADPDKISSIERQVSLKAAIELAVHDKIEVKHVGTYAKKFEEYLGGE